MTGIPISRWGVTVEMSDEEIGYAVRKLITHGYEAVVVKRPEGVPPPTVPVYRRDFDDLVEAVKFEDEAGVYFYACRLVRRHFEEEQ